AGGSIQRAARPEKFGRFFISWHRGTGPPPADLVFDSQLTTYANLNRLNQRGIRFLTLRRRTRRMLGAIWSRPAAAWRRITLTALTRSFRHPRVLDERSGVNRYAGSFRQSTCIAHPAM